ncbi:protein spaetzle isoform X1 [Drosophila takahashii]|uniref:protein spaetzle isoform X1 n=1 Tax=Drosophila takahashii TaxID=29030 RepID=UPI001CF88EF4|nr:protein spaetzle isoform X1 [Drosophila takahashii]
MMMMTPMWIALLKVLVLLISLFTAIVYINIEILKRQEAELKAAKAERDYNALLASTQGAGCKHSQYEAKDYDGVIRELFTVTNETGVVLFNTTTADSAPFMPIPTKRGDPHLPQNQNQNQRPNQNQSPNRHYNQYHSLSQPDQYFKVQRSPDGKLNLVFNDTFVSLQESNTEVQSDQANHPPRRPMDSFVFPDSPLVANRSQQSLVNGTNEPCSNSKDSSKTFCTEVDDYPDLSKLKAKLDKFAKFFVSDFLPTDVSSRVGDYDKEEKFLCKSTRRLMYPKKGQKTDKTWQLIVNNDEFKQGIQIEECDGDGVPCEYAKNFPNNYQPICKQHYMQQTLASIENEGELDVVQQTFLIPSCCKCAIRVIN